MEEEVKIKCRHDAAAGFGGTIWFAAWLFTVGFLKLGFWKALLALLLWPFYLGQHFAI